MICSGNYATVIGADILGLYYGVGKLLRSVDWYTDNVCFGNKDISETPKKSMRGIYFATHFHNFYHDAPIERVYEVVEDILLWGM